MSMCTYSLNPLAGLAPLCTFTEGLRGGRAGRAGVHGGIAAAYGGVLVGVGADECGHVGSKEPL